MILFLALADKFEFDKDTFNDVSASRNRTGTFSDIVIYKPHEKTDNEKKIIKDLESKITGLNLVITNLNTKIVDITKERDILQKNNRENIKDYSTLKYTLKDYKEVDDIEKLRIIINEKDDEIALLKENNKNLLENVNDHKTVATALKNSINFELNKDEKLMCVIFMSSDQQVHYPIICKNNQKFNEMENLLYDKFPEYKEFENYFLLYGKKISKSLTLDENKIKYGDIITMTKYEEDVEKID